jgi:hydroxymethylpyrimidine pyrophosphatase-like HAD family hydrolase/fructoselysine-6-P-deglycase FrlB-like protein
MGKPYESELAKLEATYSWAMTQDINGLASALNSLRGHCVQAIGSGGSYSIAHFAAFMHQTFSAKLAKAITPLEAIYANNEADTGSIILSAGGENPDILSAFRDLVRRELRKAVVICFSAESQLAVLAREYHYIDLIDFNVPSGRDGFVATNTLLGFAVLLTRAYSASFSSPDRLPASFAALLHPTYGISEYKAAMRSTFSPLWSRRNLLVLYGPSTHAAALDFESKFSEVALSPVQITDFRNFAHGRHHWLAKRGDETGVVAFVAEEDRYLADRTLPLLPSDIPTARLDFPVDRLAAGVAALASVLYAVGFAGEAQGIDPGRPGVPSFGRKIYNLNVLRQAAKPRSRRESVAIQRKRNVGGGNKSFDWEGAYKTFVGQMKATKFSGIVFDYDGTLCDRHDRYVGIRDAVSTHLQTLLSKDVLVGIATGRGKSVSQDLRSKIPKKYWNLVMVGYYNGSDIGFLEDDVHPNGSDKVCHELTAVADALRDSDVLTGLAACTYRFRQITVEPKESLDTSVVWDITQQIVARFMASGVTLVRSTHSVDVLAPGVSKRQLVSALRSKLRGDCNVLCVGDAGRWPGNDFALLSEPFSLSVDEVSSDPHTCWNLAPEGHRWVQACIDYMQVMKPRGSVVVFEASKVGSTRQ